MTTVTLYGVEITQNFPGDAERDAAYILHDASKLVHSADAWHMLRSAESYLWKQYNNVRRYSEVK